MATSGTRHPGRRQPAFFKTSFIFSGRLTIADDFSNFIYFSASADGQTWPNGQRINNADSTCNTLAACVFRDKLFLFWQASLNAFSVSTDCQTWPNGANINGLDYTIGAVAACVHPGEFQGKLYLFWRADDESDRLFFSASSDRRTWPSGMTVNGLDSTAVAPAALSEVTLDLF